MLLDIVDFLLELMNFKVFTLKFKSTTEKEIDQDLFKKIILWFYFQTCLPKLLKSIQSINHSPWSMVRFYVPVEVLGFERVHFLPPGPHWFPRFCRKSRPPRSTCEYPLECV